MREQNYNWGFKVGKGSLWVKLTLLALILVLLIGAGSEARALGDPLLVIVMLDNPSLVEKGYDKDNIAGGSQVFASEITSTQLDVIQQAKEVGVDGRVVANYKAVLNGFTIEVDNYEDILLLKKIPGVSEVYMSQKFNLIEQVGSNINNRSEIIEDPIPLLQPESRIRLADMRTSHFSIQLYESIPWLGIEDIWALGYYGQDVKVGILDTGIDYTHPDLTYCYAGNWPDTGYYGGYDFVDNDIYPYDLQGHGTHVSGIVAASGEQWLTGVAPEAWLYSYRVLNEFGEGTTSDVIAGLDRAVLDGMDAVNLSIGSPNTDTAYEEALRNTVAAGVLVITAAGNQGPNYYTTSPSHDISEILSVGATNIGTSISDYSSRGPGHFSTLVKPDLVAPGGGDDYLNEGIVSTYPVHLSLSAYDAYAISSGTSMAAPHVTGIASLLLVKYPNYTPDLIKQLLMNNTRWLSGYDVYEQGAGQTWPLNAFNTTFSVFPASISFHPGEKQHTFNIKNNSSNIKTYYLSTMAGDDAVSLTLNTNSFSLSPGQTKTITVKLNMLPETPSGYYSARVTATDGSSIHANVPVGIHVVNPPMTVSFPRATGNFQVNGTISLSDSIDFLTIGLYDQDYNLLQTLPYGPADEGTVNISMNLPEVLDGDYNLRFTVNYLGFVFEEDYPLFIDTSPPRLFVDGSTTNSEALLIDGYLYEGMLNIEEYEGPVFLTIENQAVPVAPDGSFSYQVTLAEGENIIEIYAEDYWGHNSTQLVSFTKVSIENMRLMGVNRYETAIAISREGWITSEYALLARGDVFADALAGAPLAAALDAPLLLTNKTTLNPAVNTELDRLGVNTVYILGGTGAISQEIEDYLRNDKLLTVIRLYGTDRFETAVQIAHEYKAVLGLEQFDNIVVTSGMDFPDALVAGPYAYFYSAPILLVQKTNVPTATASAVKNDFPDAKITIIGGNGPISADVANLMDSLNGEGELERIMGSDRYMTGIEIAKALYGGISDVPLYIARGDNFADALASGPLAAKNNGLVILTGNTRLPNSLKSYMETETFFAVVKNLHILGGYGAVSDESVMELLNKVQIYWHILAELSWNNEADLDLEIWTASEEYFCSSYMYIGPDIPWSGQGSEWFEFRQASKLLGLEICDFSQGEWIVSPFMWDNEGIIPQVDTMLKIHFPDGRPALELSRQMNETDQWFAVKINEGTGSCQILDYLHQTLEVISVQKELLK